MPAKVQRVFKIGRRLPAAVILLAAFLNLAPAGPALATGSAWRAARDLNVARYSHTATLLPNGQVLVVGGTYRDALGTHYLASCELYHPGSDTWTATGTLATARSEHTATLLPNGKVLVVGGYNSTAALYSAELYDPATGTWSSAGTFSGARYDHTATLLTTGKVLVVGGFEDLGGEGAIQTARLYDPATGTWSNAPSLTTPRARHTATLLPDGTVLVAGGYDTDTSSQLNTAQIYTPDSGTGTWSGEATFTNARSEHTATRLPDGSVLLAGGFQPNTPLYIYASGSWATGPNMLENRWDNTATLLPNGQVLVAGGRFSSYLNTAEIYSGGTGGTWSATASLTTARAYHTATLLPNGQVLVVGGQDASFNSLSSCELYDYAAGTWTTTGSLAAYRDSHTATLLPNGKVLVAGGEDINSYTASAELYDYSGGTWTGTGSLHAARYEHTATLLANGKVLVVGGWGSGGDLASVELYDYSAGTWTGTGSLGAVRDSHTATLLANGQVLVAGGEDDSGSLASCELYDPVSGTWTPTGSLNTARVNHTATLLPNGKVLVAGGFKYLNSAELYDPATGNWTPTGELNHGRYLQTATLLPNGQVLVVAGDATGNSAELYDPATGTWTPTGSLNTSRYDQTATLLPNGRVLVAGGWNNGILSSCELYDPATGLWSATGGLNIGRDVHTATLLPSGRVLVAGDGAGVETSTELFDPGLGFTETWRPTLSTVSSPVTTGEQLYLTSQGVGTGFRGISGGSGGSTNDSPTDYPLVQVRKLDSERQFWAPSSSFSNTSFTSQTFQDIQSGYYLVSVFAGGIPSISRIVQFINLGSPTAVQLKSFLATGETNYVQLDWQTGAEINIAAFRLWRRDGAQGDYAPCSSLIPAKGSPSQGARYSYRDTQVVRGHTYYYQLEVIASDDTDTFHGPISATVYPVPPARGNIAPILSMLLGD